MLKFCSCSPLKKTPKKPKTLRLIYLWVWVFFPVNDILDPNPYPVTQLCVNANTQGAVTSMLFLVMTS